MQGSREDIAVSSLAVSSSAYEGTESMRIRSRRRRHPGRGHLNIMRSLLGEAEAERGSASALPR